MIDKWVMVVLFVGLSIYLVFFTSLAKDVGSALGRTFTDVAVVTDKVKDVDMGVH